MLKIIVMLKIRYKCQAEHKILNLGPEQGEGQKNLFLGFLIGRSLK
jgi:hypothetical protein